MADARTQQDWSRTSAVLALTANVHRDPKKVRPYKPSDFYPVPVRKEVPAKVGIEVLKEVFVDSPASR